MTSSAEKSPRIVVFGRSGRQLGKFKREIPHGTNNNLKGLIRAVKALQEDTNDFLSELVVQEKSHNKNDDSDSDSDRNAEESDDQDEDNTSYNGSKYTKKRKM